MRLVIAAAIAVSAAAFSGCATSRHGDVPRPEIGLPDTWRFKMYVNAFTGEERAWEALKPAVERFKAENGYSTYAVVNRMYSQMGYFEYSVKFAR